MPTARNIEFKARFDKTTDVKDLASATGADVLPTRHQTDTYFNTPRGRLKLRETEHEAQLIYYERLNSATARESRYLATPVQYQSDIKELLGASLGTRVVVSKTRTVLRTQTILINLDTVHNLGRFIEVEVSTPQDDLIGSSIDTARQFQHVLGLNASDFVPFSYADLALMRDSAHRWRQTLSDTTRTGRLYLLDGVSGSGKTSLLYAILQDRSLDLACVPRHTTRAQRKGAPESEYIFVSSREFHDLVSAGAFMEFRDFDFGMSYGLSWDRAIQPLIEGKNAVGIIDLGNVRHVAELFPEAVRILVDAPLTTIERRLRTRGYNTEEQIQERLGNAKLIDAYRPYYDHVINNDDDLFDTSVSHLRRIIA